MAKPVEIEILLKDRMSAGLEAMQRKLDALMGKASGTDERVRILSTAIAALNAQLAEMKAMGVKRLVALRGDLPSGYGIGGEFHYASDLVAFIRLKTNLRGAGDGKKRAISDGEREIIAFPVASNISKNRFGITAPINFTFDGGNPFSQFAAK